MQLWINNWAASLVLPLGAAGTTAEIDPNAVARLAGLGGSGYYTLTLIGLDALGNEAEWEIVRATAATGGALTIERAGEGTAPRDWPVGTRIEARLTAGALTGLASRISELERAADEGVELIADLQARIEALEAGGGGVPDGALVDSNGNVLIDADDNILVMGE